MLENPLRAWLWALDEVKKLLELTGWDDFDYWACALGGARAKGQRIRSNVEELTKIRCQCHHVHSTTEWKPWWDTAANRWTYPSAAEQEYTAELAFAIAVAASAWAVRAGRASMRTQPPAAEAEHFPRLLRTPGLIELPENCVYIGRGNLTWRLAQTQWTSPFLIGPHGTPEACLRRYAHWLQAQPGRLAQAKALRGKALLCDCPAGQACHGEAIIAAAVAQKTVILTPQAEHGAPDAPRHRPGRQQRRAASWTST